MPASLLLPMGRNGPAFLAYENFGIYLQWNQSLTYATTAAYLATRIAGAPEMGSGRSPVVELSGDETKELQTRLAKRGFDVGNIDGLAGAKTRSAVKAMGASSAPYCAAAVSMPAGQCSLTCGSVRRGSVRERASSATLVKPCSATSCIL